MIDRSTYHEWSNFQTYLVAKELFDNDLHEVAWATSTDQIANNYDIADVDTSKTTRAEYTVGEVQKELIIYFENHLSNMVNNPEDPIQAEMIKHFIADVDWRAIAVALYQKYR